MYTFRKLQILRSFALSIAASAIAHAGVVVVTPVVVPNGPLFQYTYSITNGTGIDLPVLDIAVAPGAMTIQNLAAPVGFQTAYDSGLGLVSFLEDTAVFGPTAISGFSFSSPFSPRATIFTATFADASTASGSTQGPVVPEPASLTLFAAGGAALLFWRKKFLASHPL